MSARTLRQSGGIKLQRSDFEGGEPRLRLSLLSFIVVEIRAVPCLVAGNSLFFACPARWRRPWLPVVPSNACMKRGYGNILRKHYLLCCFSAADWRRMVCRNNRVAVVWFTT
ncbi:unnamed protein product [Ectocarpus sp. 4 AP-2014]